MVELLEYAIHFPVRIKKSIRYRLFFNLNRVFIKNEIILEILRQIFP